MCCIVKILLYLALVLNYLHYCVFSICRISKYLLYWALVLNYIHCLMFSTCCISKYLLYLALVMNYVFNLPFLMHGFAKKLLYLALVLNFIFIWKFRGALLQNTFNIWRLCWTTSLIVNVDVLHCTTPLIFGACVELHPLFGVCDVLHFKIHLIFGTFAELRLWLSMRMCCIAKDLLY